MSLRRHACSANDGNQSCYDLSACTVMIIQGPEADLYMQDPRGTTFS